MSVSPGVTNSSASHAESSWPQLIEVEQGIDAFMAEAYQVLLPDTEVVLASRV